MRRAKVIVRRLGEATEQAGDKRGEGSLFPLFTVHPGGMPAPRCAGLGHGTHVEGLKVETQTRSFLLWLAGGI